MLNLEMMVKSESAENPHVKYKSKNTRWLAFLLLCIWVLFISTSSYEAYRQYNSLKNNFIQHETEKTARVKTLLENQMQQIYNSLRTLSRLPSIQKIDRYAENFDEDGRNTFQEIYNNLFNSFKVSEIYVVPAGMNSNRIDPKTNKKEEPIITFDQFIVGVTAAKNNPHRDEALEQKIEEVEEFEYREMMTQLYWFNKYYPLQSKIKGLDYPALFSKQVITCDNSRLDPSKPLDHDREGIIFSVPFYDRNGKFKGLISAVFLIQAIKELLPSGYYLLKRINDPNVISSADFHVGASNDIDDLLALAKTNSINSDLIYSEQIKLNFYERTPTWQLWAGRPNKDFYNSHELKQAIKLYVSIYFIITFVVVGLYLILRKFRKEDHEKMKNLLVKFHGRSVADSIINQTLQVGGKTRDAILLFADIRGFSTFAENKSPQEVVSLLNEYLSIMIKIIEKNEGVVDKFIGDSIMAVWGAPKRKPNDVKNALMTCLEMRLALDEFNLDRQKRKLDLIKIGMGLHTGQVISGIIGSEQRMEYTVIGNAVNVASRVQNVTKLFSTDLLVTEDLVERAGNNFIFEKAGTAEVRGIKRPIQLFKVKGYINPNGISCLVHTDFSENAEPLLYIKHS